MRENTLRIVINKPVQFLFEFSLNPQNTPRWVDSIQKEVASERPTKLGTIYKNWTKEGVATEYEVTDFGENRGFTLSEIGGDYNVRYTFLPINDNQTEFEYHEWVSSGKLEHPFAQTVLEEFKEITEG